MAVVQGELDQRIDPASLAAYEGLAHVTVTRVHGAGHSPVWEAPDAVAAGV